MRYIVAFDTICTFRDDKGEPYTFKSEALAQAEIDDDPEFHEDCFVCGLHELGHKTIYRGEP